jgi:predicted RNase H-like HicB family nuclease
MSKNNETYNVGLIWPGDEHSVEIMQDAEGNFITDEKHIKDWVYCLNNPWSGTSMEYEIYPNYQKADEWIARKKVIVYDSLDACIAARGSTPKEALDNLKLFILEVTEQYYEEKEEEDE